MGKAARRLLLDADILINWLAKETDPATAAPLWEAPYNILGLVERGVLKASIALTTLLEIRFVLRRKKGVGPEMIERMIEGLLDVMDVYVPDEISLLKANQLQGQYPLDPFDAILLACGLSAHPDWLIVRDKSLLAIASRISGTPEAVTPEVFLSRSVRFI